MAWIFAIVLALIPALGAQWAGKDLSAWIPAYVAGGLGGLVLELLLSRWQLELPSKGKKPKPSPASPPPPPPPPASADAAASTGAEADDSDAMFGNPLGVQMDLGFFGRFLTGGLGAVTFLILGAVILTNKTLGGLQSDARSNLTIAWALALGASSPAVWRGIKKLSEARIARVTTGYEKKLTAADHEVKTVKKVAKAAAAELHKAKASKERKRKQHAAAARAGHIVIDPSQVQSALLKSLKLDPKVPRNTVTVMQLSEDLQTNALPALGVAGEDDAAESEAIDKALGALELLDS